MSELTLFCLLDGDAPSKSFPVKAQPTLTVGELKKLIKLEKAPQFDAFPADQLTLWKVSIPVNRDNLESPINPRESENEVYKLSDPTDEVREIYQTGVLKKTIHLLVEKPKPVAPPAPIISLENFSPSLTTQANNEIRAVLAKAFDVTYKDCQNMVDRFIRFLDLAAESWQKNLYVAPYSTLVQSSMFGKSRLMKEVGKRRCSFYVCLRKQQSSGFPARSLIASDLLVQEKSHRRWAVYLRIALFMAACHYELATYLKTEGATCEEWFNQQIEETHGSGTAGDCFWTKIQNRMKDITCEKYNISELLNHKDIDEFPKRNLRIMDSLISSSVQQLNGLGNGALVWVFDEARELLYSPFEPNISDALLFHAVRIVLGRHFRGSRVFAMMLDTQSNVKDFSPVSTRDPSLRYLSNGSQLYDVWSSTGSFNSLAQHPNIDDILSSNENTLELHKKIFTLGRPYWGSYLTAMEFGQNNELAKIAIDELTSVAEAKLLGGVVTDPLDEAAAIAMLGFRVTLWVAPQTELASKVVSSNMAFCLSISEDRRTIDTLFPSEPILAEASGLYLSNGGWANCINLLYGSIRRGAVGPGYRGELVCRILLQMAWDQSILSSCPLGGKGTVTKVTTVKNFLETMLHTDSLNSALKDQVEDKVKDQFMDGMIFFTHFEPIEYMPKRSQLMNFFLRGAAIQCKDGHPAADQIIPVLVKHDGEWKISFIIVQDKCHSTYPSNVFETCDLITPKSACLDTDTDTDSSQDANLPYLLLYLEVGSAYKRSTIQSMKFAAKGIAKKRKAEMESPANPPYDKHYSNYRMAVGVFGLDETVYTFLGKEDRRSLMELRTAKYDPVDNLEKRRLKAPKDELKSVFTLAHKLEALEVLHKEGENNIANEV